MGTHKILLEEFIDYDFTLIAIHGSLEPYYIAFLLNKHVNLRLARCKIDLQVGYKDTQASYPLFECRNDRTYIDYFLLANRIKTPIKNEDSGLFNAQQGSKSHYVIPEMPQVDYFLKIIEEGNAFAKAKLIKTLNSIPQIVTAYTVEVSTLKNKENLIFE